MGKMATPKITIVTPSFNQGLYLQQCIESILSQNYPNLEYIVMDGGSTDNSVEIIKRYEKYFSYWQSMIDGGQYSAINEGFKRSSGSIMGWLNSDDKLHPDSLFKIAGAFLAHENVAWITGRHTFWDKKGNITHVDLNVPEHSRQKYLQKQYDSPWVQQESTFWRRSLWDKAGGYIRTDLEYAGDLELWTRFFRLSHLCPIDALLGGYRIHGNQKAVLFMDQYRLEADKVLDAEVNLFNKDELVNATSAPSPINVSEEDVLALKAFSLSPDDNHYFPLTAGFSCVENFTQFIFTIKKAVRYIKALIRRLYV